MKKFSIFCLAVFIALGLRGMASAAPTVAPTTFFDFDCDALADTSAGKFRLGETFAADLYVDGIGEDEGGLITWSLQFIFNPTQVHTTSFIVDAANWFIPAAWSPAIDNTTGLVEICDARYDGGLTGTIRLGTAEFKCMGPGVSTLVMQELFPEVDTFDSFVLKDFTVLDKIITYGSAEVCQGASCIPLPGTLVLFGSGIIGLIGIRKKVKLSPD